MAPPPPTQGASLQQRLLQLAQTLQFAWFAGHVTLLLCTTRYVLSYITFNAASKWARFSYRTAFVAAGVTYGIVVYKSFRARARAGKSQGSPLAIIADENVQYLAMALVWLFAHQVPLAVFPFAVYSLFHVATYTRSNLLPAISPAPAANSATASPGGSNRPKSNSALADTIGRFVKDYYDSSMTIVAGLEIALWVRLLFPALTFQKGTWLLLLAYTVFLRARYAQSTFVQGAFGQAGAYVDSFANRQDSPPALRNAWATVKGVLRQALQATDINRFAGAQGPVKKAQ
ncbi:hypothetical protein K461DRAFT_285675 [Myriangium duriaei CBS 260.36]|uniref:Nucleoporin POM33 n=1 Tax=Myriangium duriaei CBS 260.36 TaxID=1168546 RepID=A0A9P4J342_9PEZI|nr:hypothetical protein K461DRAFT_285675 [Myriangium duriaei CBS 260.36]